MTDRGGKLRPMRLQSLLQADPPVHVRPTRIEQYEEARGNFDQVAFYGASSIVVDFDPPLSSEE